MLSYFRWVLFFIALFVTLMGGSIYVGHVRSSPPQGPLEATKNVVIPRGAGPATMSKLLQEEGVIAHPRLFRVALMIDPSPKPIKAGEYEVPAHIPPCRRARRTSSVGQGRAAPPYRFPRA